MRFFSGLLSFCPSGSNGKFISFRSEELPRHINDSKCICKDVDFKELVDFIYNYEKEAVRF